MLEAVERVNSHFCYYLAHLHHRSAGGLLLSMMQIPVEKASLPPLDLGSICFLHCLSDTREWCQQTAMSSSRWSPLVSQLWHELLALYSSGTEVFGQPRKLAYPRPWEWPCYNFWDSGAWDLWQWRFGSSLPCFYWRWPDAPVLCLFRAFYSRLARPFLAFFYFEPFLLFLSRALIWTTQLAFVATATAKAAAAGVAAATASVPAAFALHRCCCLFLLRGRC